MPDFKNDWALLQAARINSSNSIATNVMLPSGNSRNTAVSFAPIP
jgi:hypothetical protein